MKLSPKLLKKEGENNQRILKEFSKSIRSGKLMKTKTEKQKKLDKTNMNIPELKYEFRQREGSLWNSTMGNPP